MNDEEREINSLVTKFFRHMERYEVEDHNPYHRSEAEQALKFAAQLSSVMQVRQLQRIAEALEGISEVMVRMCDDTPLQIAVPRGIGIKQ